MKKQQQLVLAVVAVVAILFCGVTEARMMTKCELKTLLEEAELALPEKVTAKGLTDEDFIAKIVCHVELTTNFSTSAVNQLAPDSITPPTFPPRPPKAGPGRRERRGAGKKGGKNGRGGKNGGRGGKGGEDSSDEVWGLYGIFQLSDHIICAADSEPTPNLCQMDCADLIDDDVSDDIGCIETLKQRMSSPPDEHSADLYRMGMLLFQRECYPVVAATYFADC